MVSALLILDLEIDTSLRRQSFFPLDEYSDGEFIARYRITRYVLWNF